MMSGVGSLSLRLRIAFMALKPSLTAWAPAAAAAVLRGLLQQAKLFVFIWLDLLHSRFSPIFLCLGFAHPYKRCVPLCKKTNKQQPLTASLSNYPTWHSLLFSRKRHRSRDRSPSRSRESSRRHRDVVHNEDRHEDYFQERSREHERHRDRDRERDRHHWEKWEHFLDGAREC